MRSAAVVGGRNQVPAWGPGSVARIDEDVLAPFLAYDRGGESYVEVRTVSPVHPDRVSAPVHRYAWETRVPRVVLHDGEHDRWLLYYRDLQHETYGVLAAATPSGLGSGTTPVRVSGRAPGPRRVRHPIPTSGHRARMRGGYRRERGSA
jgi:hypothetical protein